MKRLKHVMAGIAFTFAVGLMLSCQVKAETTIDLNGNKVEVSVWTKQTSMKDGSYKIISSEAGTIAYFDKDGNLLKVENKSTGKIILNNIKEPETTTKQVETKVADKITMPKVKKLKKKTKYSYYKGVKSIKKNGKPNWGKIKYQYGIKLIWSKVRNADGYEVLPVIIAPERKKQLNKNLIMFFTGFTRFSSDVQKANAAGKVDKTAQLKEMLELVDEAEKVLVNKERDLDDFGRMLNHTWKLKRQTGSAVSTNSIDELYAKGIAAGALGGKLLGAGGGGFLVFYVQPDRQDAVRWAMRDLLYIPFQFEDGGTRVIHYTPEDYVPKD